MKRLLKSVLDDIEYWHVVAVVLTVLVGIGLGLILGPEIMHMLRARICFRHS